MLTLEEYVNHMHDQLDTFERVWLRKQQDPALEFPNAAFPNDMLIDDWHVLFEEFVK